MKYTSRITATIPCFIISFWLLRHTFHHGTGSALYISLSISVFSIMVAWYIGARSDKARLYYEEMVANKEKLEKSEERLHAIFDSVDATIWSNDVVKKRIFVSKGIEKLTGYPAEIFYNDYHFWNSLVYPEDEQKVFDFYESLMSGSESAKVETRYIQGNGEIVWAQVSGTPIHDEGGNLVSLHGVVIDITDQKKAEAELQESENRYRSVLELSPNLIFIYQQQKVVYANPATAKIIGLENSCDVIGKSIYDFLNPSDINKAKASVQKIIEHERGNEYVTYKIKKMSGETIFVELLGREIMYNGATAILVVGNDVTERREYQQKMRHMAYHDALTGLPNRYMYNETLELSLRHCSAEHQKMAIMFLDLDRFKFINDTMGHEAGDELLKLVADRLITCVRREDLVFRLGGDEFVILLVDVDKDTACEVSKRIIDSFSTPYMIENKAFYSSPSIGISMYPEDGIDKETLSRKADIAMYTVKNSGKNNYQFYQQEQETIVDRKNQLEQDIRDAITNEEFYLVHQPEFDLETGKTLSIEALIRWNHPVLGKVFPDEFIPVAEQTGLIIQLGKWILQQACKENRSLRAKGIDVKFAVNVSPLQFEDESLIAHVAQELAENELPPESLIIEITESVMQNIHKTGHMIRELKKIGVEIAVDDFGTGYSSLSVLSNLTIDYLKIDRSFVNDMMTNPNTATLVKTIIEMGQNLSFELIAEGIETQEQANFLLKHGCYYGQGYYYSVPLPLKDLEGLLVDGLI